MRLPVVLLATFASVVTGAGVRAASTPIFEGLFPTDRAPKAGASLNIRTGPVSIDMVRVDAVTFLSRPGTNPGEGSKPMCGLVITPSGGLPQGVVTVGTGVTDATPSCDAILAVGTVSAAPGERVRRIGVIHAVSSRNAPDGRTAVVLHRDPRGMWCVDEAATAEADTATRYTIADLRRKLK